MDSSDYVGADDILPAECCCSYKRERSFMAFCFVTGALRATFETKLTGLNNIPPKSKIEQNAYYRYRTASFWKL